MRLYFKFGYCFKLKFNKVFPTIIPFRIMIIIILLVFFIIFFNLYPKTQQKEIILDLSQDNVGQKVISIQSRYDNLDYNLHKKEIMFDDYSRFNNANPLTFLISQKKIDEKEIIIVSLILKINNLIKLKELLQLDILVLEHQQFDNIDNLPKIQQLKAELNLILEQLTRSEIKLEKSKFDLKVAKQAMVCLY